MFNYYVIFLICFTIKGSQIKYPRSLLTLHLISMPALLMDHLNLYNLCLFLFCMNLLFGFYSCSLCLLDYPDKKLFSKDLLNMLPTLCNLNAKIIKNVLCLSTRDVS